MREKSRARAWYRGGESDENVVSAQAYTVNDRGGLVEAGRGGGETARAWLAMVPRETSERVRSFDSVGFGASLDEETLTLRYLAFFFQSLVTRNFIENLTTIKLTTRIIIPRDEIYRIL